ASALSRSLSVVSALVAAGETDVRTALAAARSELDAAPVQTEYLQIVSPNTLLPMTTIDGPALVLVAARVGSTRLIDNQPLSPDPTSSRPSAAAGSNTRSD
ncbi:MAG TPA: pantoate--beta-alanine ligase, partial [Solirubrobacteraceae bacterium]|nr:pantoate--beta-alanine ligase [Solirubrobacteraceae bacterium]